MRGGKTKTSDLKVLEKPSWVLSPDGEYSVYKKAASGARDNTTVTQNERTGRLKDKTGDGRFHDDEVHVSMNYRIV